MNCKDFDKWPEVDKSKIISKINLVVQINGKTRDIIQVEKDLDEQIIKKLILDSQRLKNILVIKKLLRHIC